ncbi:PREDICTED: uncharacterized protein LOC109148049 isoform X2 [Ipomoea nil]|uniref:uncharacterized protein LOC109148049 isoform X2 n=1 Tax=Ipomoea nil TaxID=35883 RepID=UPI0009020128|nr:PREDICTED: uncharacterized protein LOC109148049 isoform X2 [Ipomoea nil]
MEQRARLEEKSPNPEVDHQSEKATEQIGGVKVRSKVTSGIFVNEVRSVLAENQLKDESSAESTKLKQKRDSGREFSISLTQSNDSTESKKGKILLRVGEYEIFFDIDELEEIMEKAADNKDLMEDLLADRFLEEAEKVCQMKITGSCNLERKVMEKLKTKYKGLLIADIASKEPLENEAKTPANISEAESGEKDVSDCLRETKSEAPQMNKESKEETNPPGNLKGDVYAPQLNKEAEVSVERPEIRSQVVEGATDKSEAMDKKNAQSEFAYTAEQLMACFLRIC